MILALGVAGARLDAQTTSTTATLTRWDVFAATGGITTSSTSATQNPVSVAVHPADGSVWFATQRPTVRLGRLDPAGSSGNYLEWAAVVSPATSGTPVGLTISQATGDVWFTTGGVPHLGVKLAGT